MNPAAQPGRPPQQRQAVHSFAPRVDAGCRVLVLGTAPSVRSLELQQAYAHPQNLFWPIMGELYDAGPSHPYDERIERLQQCGVGVWDVFASCERVGSLDSRIVAGSEKTNDVPALLERHPGILAIALNGTKAQAAFRRHIAPAIPPARLQRLTLLALPSTSPAYASMSRQDKLERWGSLLTFAAPAHVQAAAVRWSAAPSASPRRRPAGSPVKVAVGSGDVSDTRDPPPVKEEFRR